MRLIPPLPFVFSQLTGFTKIGLRPVSRDVTKTCVHLGLRVGFLVSQTLRLMFKRNECSTSALPPVKKALMSTISSEPTRSILPFAAPIVTHSATDSLGPPRGPPASTLIYADGAQCAELVARGVTSLGRNVFIAHTPLEAVNRILDSSVTTDAVFASLQDDSFDVIAFFEFLQETYPKIRRIAFARHGRPTRVATDSCLHDMILWDPWDQNDFAEVLRDAIGCRRYRGRSSWSDQELFLSGGGVDNLAISTILQRYHHRIVSLVQDQEVNRQDAEDLVQDVYMGIVEELPSFGRECSPGCWIDRVTAKVIGKWLMSENEGKSSRGTDAMGESDGSRLRRSIDHEGLSVELVSAWAGDRPLTDDERDHISQYRAQRGSLFFSDLLYAISHHHFAPEIAEVLWEDIVAHKHLISGRLGRNVRIAVAALDFLSNIHDDLLDPTLMTEAHASDIASLSMRDGMTGLFNHSTAYEILELELAACHRYGTGLSVMIVDVDDFKQINDRGGHLQGDRTLIDLAAILREEVRESDVVCRFGGDEFLVILPRMTDARAAAEIAARIRRSAQSLHYAGQQLSVSIGLALSNREPLLSRALVDAADRALYVAKTGGKNRVVVATHGRPPRPSRPWAHRARLGPLACDLCSETADLHVDPNCEDSVICSVCMRNGMHTYSVEDLGTG